MLPGPNKSTKLVVLKDRHGLMPISQTIMHFKIQNAIITEVNVKDEMYKTENVNGFDDSGGYDTENEIIPF
jgi:hypothetical protein